MSGHTHTLYIFHFQLDIRINCVISKYTTSGQELAVRIQCRQCFFQAGCNLRNLGFFFSGQIVQVVICCIARVNLVLMPSRPVISSAAKARQRAKMELP